MLDAFRTWTNGKEKLAQQQTDLETLIANAREERSALSAMLTYLTARSVELVPIGKSLEPDAIFWMAYPKGTSKRYKGADINRDTAHARMGKLGFEGVSLVAIDDDWSAMRFKRKA